MGRGSNVSVPAALTYVGAGIYLLTAISEIQEKHIE
jgi:hypothetical protein